MKNLLLGFAGLSLMVATSAQAVTLSPVMICKEAIHSEFGVTSVQIDSEQLPVIHGQDTETVVQATLSESSMNQDTQVLGQYPVIMQPNAEVDAPAVYMDTAGTFKLTVDIHGVQTLGGMTQATLEYSDNSGAPVTQGMVCHAVTQ